MGRQIILEDLSLKERIKFLENRKNNSISILKGTTTSVVYEIKQLNKTIVNDKVLLDSSTQKEWLVSNVLPKDGSFIFDITFTKNEIIRQTPIYNEIMDFSKKIHETYSHLLLRTDFNGCLVEVVNKQEITGKWEDIKTYQLARYFAGAEKDNITLALDKEFQDPLSGFMRDWLYFLFFIPSSQNRNKQNIGTEYKLDKFKMKSNFLQGIEVFLQKSEKLKNIDDIYIVFQQSSTLIEDVKLFGSTDTEKAYKNQYKELFGKEFRHQFRHKADYCLDLETGLIHSCKAIITEQLNEQLYSETLYEIKQKTTEK